MLSALNIEALSIFQNVSSLLSEFRPWLVYIIISVWNARCTQTANKQHWTCYQKPTWHYYANRDCTIFRILMFFGWFFFFFLVCVNFTIFCQWQWILNDGPTLAGPSLARFGLVQHPAPTFRTRHMKAKRKQSDLSEYQFNWKELKNKIGKPMKINHCVNAGCGLVSVYILLLFLFAKRTANLL